MSCGTDASCIAGYYPNGAMNGHVVATYGGYPTYNSGEPYPDADMDGMDDNWERAHGLNPNDASDGPAVDANGYTNLENFLNQLAGDPVPPSASANCQ
jgi:hypothetical protein